ncbi:MAG: alpha/beta hydrolase [Nitriliruptoraceae bacterium]|nr:alpha/beta hydrolase [Nitriliruptoraceae bacterium]
MDALARHAVTITGRTDGPTIVFGHGFGCDQSVWSRVAPAFEATHRVVRFDHVGSGRSERAVFDHTRHGQLEGYADDLVELAEALDLQRAVFIGHSISSSIGVLASIRAPHRFGQLVLIGGSPRYLDDGDYRGGFAASDVDAVLTAIDDNYLAWSTQMAPAIMGNADRPELSDALTDQFHGLDPRIARTFARATFLSDVRAALPRVTVPTLVLHCTDDAIVPDSAGHHLRDHLPGTTFVQLAATGHCPLLSAPEEIVAAIGPVLPVPIDV